MREIKFRAWDGKRMRGIGKNDWFSLRNDGMLSFGQQGDPSIALMQYTGLKDKNGKEIYEGDIVRCYDWGIKTSESILVWASEVRWSGDDKGWALAPDPTDGDRYDLFRNVEIIGNIHENSDLLKN